VDGEKLKSRKMPEGRQLETLRRTELAHNRNGILMKSIDRVIQVAHVGGGEFAGEISEGGAELGEAGESGLANDGDGVVGRKVVAVVGECDKAEGVDEAVRGIAGDNVDLMIEEGAVDEAEVHHVRLPGEVEAVQTGQGAEAVGALEEFVADAGAPLRRDGSDIRNRAKVKVFRVVAADDHGKSVFEAQRLGDFEMKAIGVELLDAVVDRGRIARGSFVEDSGERRAGVFNIEIEVAGFEGSVNEERAAEVGLAHDGDSRAGFDVLGEEFRKDDLLGEELGADGDSGRTRRTARRKTKRDDGD